MEAAGPVAARPQADSERWPWHWRCLIPVHRPGAAGECCELGCWVAQLQKPHFCQEPSGLNWPAAIAIRPDAARDEALVRPMQVRCSPQPNWAYRVVMAGGRSEPSAEVAEPGLCVAESRSEHREDDRDFSQELPASIQTESVWQAGLRGTPRDGLPWHAREAPRQEIQP